MIGNDLFSLDAQNLLMLGLTAAGGAALSLIYFGGLWLTIQKMKEVKTPAVLFLASFLLRTLIILAGFFLAAGGRMDRLVVCFVAFLLARHFILQKAQPLGTKGTPDHGL